MSTSFSLQDKMRQLETIEDYFSRPDMDLEEAITKHKQALNIGQEILSYLKTAETTLEQLDSQLLESSSASPENYISEK